MTIIEKSLMFVPITVIVVIMVVVTDLIKVVTQDLYQQIPLSKTAES